MPLMASLYTGVSGLKTSQVGIHTSSHNLANIHTEGYVRQQISYADREYSTIGHSAIGNWRLGLGVVADETRHIRDLLLDKAYRQQAGRENFYSSQYEAVSEVEHTMGELNKEAFQNSLKQLWDALSEVAKAPDGSVEREGLVMYADEFITRVNAISDQLQSYQYNLNQEVKDTVNKINSLADTIYDLNLTIQGIEAAGVEDANDYRDRRDLALDQLSQLIEISYTENEHGFVSVRAEGQEFIIESGVFHMGTEQLGAEQDSNYLSPVWEHLDGLPVFILDTDINSAKGNDIGKLKGILLSRGGYKADYTDIPVLPENYTNAEYEQYLKDAEEYNYNTGASVVMKTQAMMDRLINSIVTMINDKLCPNKEQTIAGGTQLTIKAGTNFYVLADEVKAALKAANGGNDPIMDDYGYLVGDETFTLKADMTTSMLDVENSGNGYDGELGAELFSRSDTTGRYTELTAADGTVYYVYNPYNVFGEEGLYSMGNLEINQQVLEKTSSLPLWNSEGEANYPVAESIIKAWSEASINLDPNNLAKKDFDDYYQAMLNVLGNDGSVLKSVTANQQQVVEDIETGRQSIMGVSSEEELTNLIKFQNAYNANSRYINVVADMIDTLINRVGVH